MKNYGLQHDEFKVEDYVLGGFESPEEILQPDRDWSLYLPIWEAQKKGGVETMSCVTFTTLNAIETLLARKFETTANKSDRYNAILSNTTRTGNSPHRVAESIRKDAGTIPEVMLPFDESIKTFEQYHASELITKEMRSVGEKWLTEYEFKHKWVFTGGDEEDKNYAIFEALKHSPVGVSVHAWNSPDENGMYDKEPHQRDNHFVMAFRAVEGEYIEVYDQYDKKFKKIKWGYDYDMAKSFYLFKKPKVHTFWLWEIIKRLWQ